jgi:hypothetical protein
MRGRFQRTRSTAIEHLGIICLSGPAAEELFCGPITDGGDHTDLTMAKNYIKDSYYPEITHGYHLSRLRSAAEHLVRSHWAKERIQKVADALLVHGSLDAETIYNLTSSRIRPATLEEYGNMHVIGGQSGH